MSENINNVQTLKTKLDAMSQPHRKTGKTNLWDVAVSINRTNAVPLDKSSIIFEDAVTKTEGDTTVTIPGTTIKNAAEEATAYPGQIISGLGGTDGKVYVLQPDDHKHNTHSANAGSKLTYESQTQSEKTVYEELATQSDVNYQVNKEAYQRQVANNARKNTETKIAKFILERNKSVSINEDGSIELSLPAKISNEADTTAETVLDYVIETVAAEKDARTKSDTVLAQYIGTATPSFTHKDGLINTSLTLPQKLSNEADRTATTVLGFIEETVQAEKDDRVQATFDLASYIGTKVNIAHTNNTSGSPILTGMYLPAELSDKTSTPSTVTTLLQYITATVEAEVTRRYTQDLDLLAKINDLNLSEVVSITAIDGTEDDYSLDIKLATPLRDSSSDTLNPPITKYNNN